MPKCRYSTSGRCTYTDCAEPASEPSSAKHLRVTSHTSHHSGGSQLQLKNKRARKIAKWLKKINWFWDHKVWGDAINISREEWTKLSSTVQCPLHIRVIRSNNVIIKTTYTLKGFVNCKFANAVHRFRHHVKEIWEKLGHIYDMIRSQYQVQLKSQHVPSIDWLEAYRGQATPTFFVRHHFCDYVDVRERTRKRRMRLALRRQLDDLWGDKEPAWLLFRRWYDDTCQLFNLDCCHNDLPIWMVRREYVDARSKIYNDIYRSLSPTDKFFCNGHNLKKIARGQRGRRRRYQRRRTASAIAAEIGDIFGLVKLFDETL